jgi:hypothetical protein
LALAILGREEDTHLCIVIGLLAGRIVSRTIVRAGPRVILFPDGVDLSVRDKLAKFSNFPGLSIPWNEVIFLTLVTSGSSWFLKAFF